MQTLLAVFIHMNGLFDEHQEWCAANHEAVEEEEEEESEGGMSKLSTK